MLVTQSSLKVTSDGGGAGPSAAPKKKAQAFKKLRSLKTGEFSELEGPGGSLVIRKVKEQSSDEEDID